MPVNKSKIKSQKDVLRGITSGLRLYARQPNIHGYNPHAKQRIFHSSKAKGRLFIGGNRSGKTNGGAAESVFNSTGKHPFKDLKWSPPTYGRIVTVDFNQGVQKIILPYLKQLFPPSELIDGSWEASYDKATKTLTLANGSTIEIMTYEQELEKFAGTSRHWIWFDEEPPQDIWKECMLRLIDTNGDWWITMTPVEGLTWTYDDIFESDNPSIEVIEVDMDENPYLGLEEKLEILSLLTPEEKIARKEGKYVPSGGFIYKDFLTDSVFLDSFDPPMDWLWVASMDHGLRNPTSWHWTAVSPDGELVVFDEYYKTGKLVHENAQAVHEINTEHGRPPDYNVGDPSIRNRDPITGTSVLIEYQESGISIILGNNDKRAGINLVKKRLQGVAGKPSLYIVRPKCPMLIWEMRKYRWANWKGRQANYDRNQKEEPIDKDNHACDDIRYMVASRPSDHDDGTYIPPSTLPIESGEAINPDEGLIDKEAVSIGKKQTDYNLGDEY